MTEMVLKSKKLTEILLEPKKWLKDPWNLKKTKIPPKNFICKTKMTIKILYNHSTCFPPSPKSLGGTHKFFLCH